MTTRMVELLSRGYLGALVLFAATAGLFVVEGTELWQFTAFLTLVLFAVVGCGAALNLAEALAVRRPADIERERARISAVHMFRIVRDGDYRDAAGPGPDGGTCVPVAAGDGADWILDCADEAGAPVAVVAERGGELAVYRLERVSLRATHEQ